MLLFFKKCDCYSPKRNIYYTQEELILRKEKEKKKKREMEKKRKKIKSM